jgi:hypothetical protein
MHVISSSGIMGVNVKVMDAGEVSTFDGEEFQPSEVSIHWSFTDGWGWKVNEMHARAPHLSAEVTFAHFETPGRKKLADAPEWLWQLATRYQPEKV